MLRLLPLPSHRYLLLGAATLSLIACQSQPPNQTAKNPLGAKPAVAPSEAPLPARSLKLKLKLDASLLQGFSVKQTTGTCAQSMTDIQTQLVLPGEVSLTTQTQLEQSGVTVQNANGQSTLIFSNSLQELSGTELSLEYTFSDLPTGTATGQTLFKDNTGQEFGFVNYQATITSQSGTAVTMVLSSTGTASSLPACPQLQAQLSGASMAGTGGDIIPAQAGATPTPTPTPTPSPSIDAVPPAISNISQTTGYPATEVIITGSGFLGTTQVTFGGSKAFLFTVDSDTQITARSSAVNPVAGKVKVTNPAGSAESVEDFTPILGQRTIYAKPGGTGLGNSWADAQDLIWAMAASQPGDEVWAMAGTYKQTSQDLKILAFTLKTGVNVYGGFTGSETSVAQRDWENNLTVLSSDLQGNDNYTDNDLADYADNSYHTLRADAVGGALIDGFTVEGGYAVGLVPYDRGAGFFSRNSIVTLKNMTFRNNIANYAGGAIYNMGASGIIMDNVIIEGNAAYAGGGMANLSPATADLYQVTFRQNSAKMGGGMHNDGASPTLQEVTFSQNGALYNGGGMYNRKNASPVLSHLTFSENQALSGGGVYNTDNASPQMDTVKFTDNDADNGAGMYNYRSSSPVMQQVTFKGNVARYLGGGMYNYQQSSPRMIRAAFHNNASAQGGGMYNRGESAPVVVNAVFHNNVATEGGGGGVYNYNRSSPILLHVTMFNNLSNSTAGSDLFSTLLSSPTLTSSIVWGDGANPVFQDNDGTLNANSNTVKEFENVIGTAGIGNLNIDPFFVDPTQPAGPDGIFMTGDDGLRLSTTSPSKNFGKNAGAPPTDILGALREAVGPDQGAYEGEFDAVTQPLQIQDTQVGSGQLAEVGDTVAVRYTGRLTDGTVFDSNVSSANPFSFTLGANQVIQGWEQGIPGMREGGTRQLIVPPHLGYGAQWFGLILPNSTLIFDIELVSVQKN